jgi:hypothetical protein
MGPYNNDAGYGWIEQGKEYGIRSQDGRRGAIVRKYETLSQETTIAFLEAVRRKEAVYHNNRYGRFRRSYY